MSSTMHLPSETASLRIAYRLASPAETRPSCRSNWTIGLASAMYSMILFIVEISFIRLASSGLTQTSAVASTVPRSESDSRPVRTT